MFRRRTTDDFSDEIRAHLQIETDRLIADGMGPDEARAQARRAFGNVARAEERFLEASRWPWLDQLVQDLRYAWRGMLHNRGFVATTVLTLAVGIGLVTTAFTAFNAYVLRPFAVADPSSLHRLEWHSRDNGGARFRWRDYEVLRERSDLFTAAVAESTRFVSSNGRPLAVALVSANYFDALRPRMLLGRGLSRVDEGADAAVISHQAWSRLFGRDVSVVGRTVDINGRPFSIVGVAGPGFAGLGDMPRDAWLPFTTYAAVGQPSLTGPDQPRAVEITARLRRDVTAGQASAALSPMMAEIVPGDDIVRAEVVRQDSPNPPSVQMLAVLSPVFAAFALVLVTSCANVSNVMLARAVARHREIAVRLSLGASRGRIVRQLLTEGLLIALVSGGLALALASWALRGVIAAVFRTLPPSVAAIVRTSPMEIDYRVFLFALIVAGIATLLFALVPALQASRVGLVDALRGQGGHASRGAKLRTTLVVSQVAVSIVLVIVALTLARNGAAIGAIDLGYDAAGVMSVNVREERTDLVRGLADVLGTDTSVAEIAVTGGNPLFIRTRAVAAAPAGGSHASAARFTFVSPSYFSVLRIPIARGRSFRPDEAQTDARVAIVSAATARAFWPGQDPIGRTIRIERPEGRPVEELPGYADVTVVGTVKDVVSGFVMDGPDTGHIYLPTTAASPRATAILLRGRTPADLAPDRLQRLFARAAPDPQIFEALPLAEMRELQVYPLLAASWVGTTLGAIALVLSVTGLYGVLVYTLSQRTRELGIRMALGATAGAVVGLVMRQSARLAAAGAAIGLAIAFAALLALGSVIHVRTVTVVDGVAFAAGLVTVLAAAALAAYHPARRAARIDPAITLRAE